MRISGAGSFLERKLVSLKDLKGRLAPLKAKGKVIVFTNGCFDLLHYGHVKYLEAAKSQGDILVVAINSDASVKRLKGNKRPIFRFRYRARVVAALESVDYVVIFAEDTPLATIKYLRPDILVKGADWINNIVGSDFVKSYGGKVIAAKLVKGFSTTNLVNKIAKTF